LGGEEKVKTVLLVGHSRAGKSSLASLLTNQDFFDAGPDKERIVSTYEFREGEFLAGDTKYRIVDTVG